MNQLEDKVVKTLIDIALSYRGSYARSEEEIILSIQKLSKYTNREDVTSALLKIANSKYGKDSFSENIIMAALRALP